MGLDDAHNPSWASLARGWWAQYMALGALVVLLGYSETLTPFRHVMYQGNDLEYWRYSYPLRDNHVPAWAVPLLALSSPLAAVGVARAMGRVTRLELHHAVLTACYCVVTTGVVTNFIKVNVGRPRPDFVARCWPGGAAPRFEADGRPLCSSDAVDPLEGMKSFPSGHTSWSTAGLGYLSLWLAGRLRVFAGNPRPLRSLACLAPLCVAAWVGFSRLQDYWHHVEDVAAGFLLGCLMAYCFYRQAFVGVMSPQAGMLTVHAVAAAAKQGSFVEGAASLELQNLISGGPEQV